MRRSCAASPVCCGAASSSATDATAPAVAAPTASRQPEQSSGPPAHPALEGKGTRGKQGRRTRSAGKPRERQQHENDGCHANAANATRMPWPKLSFGPFPDSSSHRTAASSVFVTTTATENSAVISYAEEGIEIGAISVPIGFFAVHQRAGTQRGAEGLGGRNQTPTCDRAPHTAPPHREDRWGTVAGWAEETVDGQ